MPEEAYITASLLKKYQPLQLRFHQGVILPIGEEPSGRSWTGFQSTVSGTQGYLVVYREDNEQARGTIDTWLPEGKKVTFTPDATNAQKATLRLEGEFDLNGILGKAKSAAAREEVSMPTAPGVLPGSPVVLPCRLI